MFAPVRVSVPAITSSPPPDPDSTPEKVSAAWARRRVCEPRVTPPAPLSVAMMVSPLVAPEMSSVPESTTRESARAPSPDSFAVAPASMVRPPLKVLAPLRVWAPPVRCRAPDPEITPAKSPVAAVRVRVLEPSATEPVLEPARDLIEAPASLRWMSNSPLATTPAESAIDPPPTNSSCAQSSTVVRPV